LEILYLHEICFENINYFLSMITSIVARCLVFFFYILFYCFQFYPPFIWYDGWKWEFFFSTLKIIKNYFSTLLFFRFSPIPQPPLSFAGLIIFHNLLLWDGILFFWTYCIPQPSFVGYFFFYFLIFFVGYFFFYFLIFFKCTTTPCGNPLALV